MSRDILGTSIDSLIVDDNRVEDNLILFRIKHFS